MFGSIVRRQNIIFQRLHKNHLHVKYIHRKGVLHGTKSISGQLPG